MSFWKITLSMSLVMEGKPTSAPSANIQGLLSLSLPVAPEQVEGWVGLVPASHSISIGVLNIHYRLGLLHFGDLWWISYVFWMITEMPYRKSYPLHLSLPSNLSFTESRLVKPDQTLSLNNWNWASSGSSWNPVIKLAIRLSGKLFGVQFFFK